MEAAIATRWLVDGLAYPPWRRLWTRLVFLVMYRLEIPKPFINTKSIWVNPLSTTMVILFPWSHVILSSSICVSLHVVPLLSDRNNWCICWHSERLPSLSTPNNHPRIIRNSFFLSCFILPPPDPSLPPGNSNTCRPLLSWHHECFIGHFEPHSFSPFASPHILSAIDPAVFLRVLVIYSWIDLISTTFIYCLQNT